MQNHLEFAENLVRNLHQNLEQTAFASSTTISAPWATPPEFQPHTQHPHPAHTRPTHPNPHPPQKIRSPTLLNGA